MEQRDIEITCGDKQRRQVRDADEDDLRWWVKNGKKDHIVAACRAELELRFGGNAAAPRTELAALNKNQVLDLCGAFDDARRATEQLAKIQEIGHLLSPAPVVSRIPEGCSVLISALLVDIERETYQTDGGERGLGKVPLDKIAGALAIQWIPHWTQRLDNARDPWYCYMQVGGRYRSFDLTWRPISDRKEIDLRDGAPLVEKILDREKRKKAKAEGEGKSYYGDLGATEISNQRVDIQSLCVTKARLRAIRTLGIRTSYTRAELQKPFFTATLIFDGRSENPEAARYFRQEIAKSFLNDSAMLYGAPAELGGHVPDATRITPPPVGTALESSGEEVPTDDDDEGPPPRAAASHQASLPGTERY